MILWINNTKETYCSTEKVCSIGDIVPHLPLGSDADLILSDIRDVLLGFLYTSVLIHIRSKGLLLFATLIDSLLFSLSKGGTRSNPSSSSCGV